MDDNLSRRELLAAGAAIALLPKDGGSFGSDRLRRYRFRRAGFRYVEIHDASFDPPRLRRGRLADVKKDDWFRTYESDGSPVDPIVVPIGRETDGPLETVTYGRMARWYQSDGDAAAVDGVWVVWALPDPPLPGGPSIGVVVG